jgi:hypothetical protein
MESQSCQRWNERNSATNAEFSCLQFMWMIPSQMQPDTERVLLYAPRKYSAMLGAAFLAQEHDNRQNFGS